ncbi:MAG: ECF-type sigma factor [Planctomycetia bacterium]|nr:ECF-type sigma factor [Planctomycetia bacterium]
MSASESVTHWLKQLNAGNPQAAEELWNRYFRRVVGLARVKLRGLPTAMADEEDVALSALRTFFRRAKDGQFPQLQGSEDLWPLLVKITARKAYNLQRYARQKKRWNEKQLPPGTELTEDELVAVIGDEPTPEFVGDLIEELCGLIELLAEEELRRIALLKLEGKPTAEIAGELGINERRVQRRLKVIYALWREKLSG